MIDVGRTPTIAEALQAVISSNLVDVHTAMPGTVVSYDAATQTADIRPGLPRTLRDADGEKSLEELPVIPAVPVHWTMGGDYFVTMPLPPGAGGLLIFSERDISAWLDQGGAPDPGDEGLHGMAGAVFVPGLSTVAARLAGIPADHMALGSIKTNQIHIDDSGVRIGSNSASHPIAKGDVVDAAFAALTTFASNVVTACAANTPPIAVVSLAALGAVSSVKHKVDS